MDGGATRARREAERRLIRQLARHYQRDSDLALVLGREVRDYELVDRHCRWITAGLMHRLCRRLGSDGPTNGRDDGISGLLVRACLRGEARRYREQSQDRPGRAGALGNSAPC